MSQQVTLIQVPTAKSKSSKCGTCQEYIKKLEPRFQLRNAKNRSEGTYCSRCNRAGLPARDAEINDWIIVDDFNDVDDEDDDFGGFIGGLGSN